VEGLKGRPREKIEEKLNGPGREGGEWCHFKAEREFHVGGSLPTRGMPGSRVRNKRPQKKKKKGVLREKRWGKESGPSTNKPKKLRKKKPSRCENRKKGWGMKVFCRAEARGRLLCGKRERRERGVFHGAQ